MAVAAPHLSTLELGEPASSYNVELTRGVLDLVEIGHQLIVGQRSVINDQQAVECRTKLAHRTSEMGTNMRATLHRATDTQSNKMGDVGRREINRRRALLRDLV
jgi:hypothetical protein